MRLSRPVYEMLPLFYAIIGMVAIVTASLDPKAPANIAALWIGLGSEIAALTVFLHRQDHRAMRREYSGGELNPR